MTADNGGARGTGLSPGDVTGGTGVAGGTAAHAAEVAASPANDPSTSSGMAAGANQPDPWGDIFAGLLSTIGVNTTKGTGLPTGPNANAFDTALQGIPGPIGAGISLGNRALEAVGVNIGQDVFGLAQPER